MILAAGFFLSALGTLGLCIWMACDISDYQLKIPHFLQTSSAAFIIGFFLMVLSMTMQMLYEGAMP